MFPPERYYGMHFVSGGVSRDFLILPPRLLSALTGSMVVRMTISIYFGFLARHLTRPPPATVFIEVLQFWIPPTPREIRLKDPHAKVAPTRDQKALSVFIQLIHTINTINSNY